MVLPLRVATVNHTPWGTTYPDPDTCPDRDTWYLSHAMLIHGSCDSRFREVEEVFDKNFDEGELGAAFVVYVDGTKVVDVWGG
jgi:hypothetical protein